MTPEQQRVIKKVKKLLALARDNEFPAEAAVAALKAQELLQKYNLELAAAPLEKTASPQEPAPDPTRIFACSEHMTALREQWVPSWVKLLVTGVGMAFDVECVKGIRGGRVMVLLIGVEPDVSVALQLFEHLYDFASSYPLPGKSSSQKNDWRMGFAINVAQRLLSRKELQQGNSGGESALVLAKDTITRDYMRENFPDIPHVRRPAQINTSSVALFEGMGVGSCVNLQGAVPPAEE